MSNMQALKEEVLANSESEFWDEAVTEWEVVDCIEDESVCETCICGKEHLRYLFTIENILNGNTLFPIGSVCIKKFGVTALSEEVKTRQGMFELYHAVEEGKYLSLSAGQFSRRTLLELYEKGVFVANEYNGGNGENDYRFLLRMFNKRDKSSITPKQEKKITAILLNTIKPYLEEQLKEKIRR